MIKASIHNDTCLMLAYELFYNNKDSNANQPDRQLPFKKIFYENGVISIDETKVENYSGPEMPSDSKQIQEWLQMALNTIDVDELNLPDVRTGKNQANPYIEIYGLLKTTKTGSKLIISLGNKYGAIEHTLDILTGEITKKSDPTINLKIDTKNYLIGEDQLFEKYVRTGIIDGNGKLNSEIYEDIANKFLNYAKQQQYEITKIGNNPFRIFILPNSDTIKFKTKTDDTLENSSFTDYFGNSSTHYASTPTKTSKFLSYDDKAFTINCKQETEFYRNLGIGKQSLQKIHVGASKTFTINRLNWMFTDITDPKFEFVQTKRGILSQLFENYKMVSNKTTKESAQIKAICIKTNQAKQELLIDENLTMEKMRNIFSGMVDVPSMCFEEVLIDNSGQNPLWHMYLYVVRNFLSGNKIAKEYILSFFNKTLKQKRYDWVKLKNTSEQKSFFSKSDFCLKYLTTDDKLRNYMDQDEEFAQSIGKIARIYVDFKKDEPDNSLTDILTYSKYDRERLRFIISRIGRGVPLSKIKEESKKSVTEKISSLQPDYEISDINSSKDLSYFFFKGYYSTQEIMA